MRVLLQNRAKIDVRINDGDTPLHQACFGRRKGLRAVVDLLLRWGADETALNSDGGSAEEMFGMDKDEDDDIDNTAKQDEIDRTRLLLSRAPADRAWRRRGSLIMLRLCSEKARTLSRCDSYGRIEGDVPGVGDELRDARWRRLQVGEKRRSRWRRRQRGRPGRPGGAAGGDGT